MKTRLPKTIIAALTVAVLTFAGTMPASANTSIDDCPGNTGFTAIIVNSTSASIRATGTGCGLLQVRVKYNLNIGVTAYTAWKTSYTYAIAYVPAGAGMISADYKIGPLLVVGVKP